MSYITCHFPLFELRLFYNYFKAIKIIPRLKVNMPSYSPEQAFVTKFYANLKKNEYTMETLNFSCTRTSKLLLNWAGITRW